MASSPMKRVGRPLITRTGDAPKSAKPDNMRVGDGDLALRNRAVVLVDFVCMAKHKADTVNAGGTTAVRSQLNAYCARGADKNHEWIRVPPTPLHEITTGLMEERPPEPAQRAFVGDTTR